MERSDRYYFSIAPLLAALSILLPSCSSRKTAPSTLTSADSFAITRSNTAHRAEMNDFFRSSPYSPFTNDTAAHFTGIRWFDIDLDFYFRSPLRKYPHGDTVIVMGTKGEERRLIRYGYFELASHDTPVRLNAYKGLEETSPANPTMLAVWFTDLTTGKETYGVGRYLEVGPERPDPGFLYAIDFNKAYNPYCAYSARYSCAIPRKEDHLPIAIRAGELKYHP